MIYFWSSQGYAVLYLVLAWQFFRTPTPEQRPALVLGMRYGLVSSVLGFAAGYWMLAAWQGRLVGESGNIVAVHAFGFHGVQAVPLVAWLVEGTDDSRARAQVHAAGALWLFASACVTVQTALGRSILDPGPVMIGAILALGALGAIALKAALDRRGTLQVAR
jgi:hypothetical protein